MLRRFAFGLCLGLLAILLTYGPRMGMTFCDSSRPRTLRVSLQSATSEAGTPMAEPPRFTLFHVLTWPLPGELQTMGGGYTPNASEVSRSNGWSLEWSISGGMYILAFEWSPFQNTLPPDRRPSSVAYTVQIVQ